MAKKEPLSITHPELAKEWHPTKNDDLKPDDVTYGSNRKVWWNCKKEHEWEAIIYNRTTGKGCPYCAGRYVSDINNLEILFPDIAKEWHPTKNGDLTPDKVTYGSNKKVWWLCRREHEWETKISMRTSKLSRCPLCTSNMSRLELRIYSEFCSLFDEVELKYKKKNKELDVYVTDINLGIEIDGLYFHKSRYNKDKEKTKYFINKGIHVVRMREKGLDKISSQDIIFDNKSDELLIISELLNRIVSLGIVNQKQRNIIKRYIDNSIFANDDYYKELLYKLPGPPLNKSLYKKFPQIAKDWHPTKNGTLKPENVWPTSNLKVWWLCENIHEFERKISASLYNRCPYCSGRYASEKNNLAYLFPDLSKEWHPTKNLDLKPDKVTSKSDKMVWWLCRNKHEWQSTVHNRSNGKGCPKCSGRLASAKHNLKYKYPQIAKDWHPTKNAELKPENITPISGKRVWWLCKNSHEVESAVSNRVNTNGYCFICNSLAYNFPELLKEWDYEKNEKDPNFYTKTSGVKVWWKCKKNHEYQQVINKKTDRGSGCPMCSGRYATIENNLSIKFPKIAEEWHPTNNGTLNPEDITPISGKRVWWLCKSKHEYQAVVYNRTGNNSGCPYCAGNRKK